MSSVRSNRGVAAGVPFVALPPEGDPAAATVVAAWHGADPPASARAMAAALPLRRLNAWRIFLDLPLRGRRPDGAAGEVVERAADGFADVLAELGTRLPLGDAALGLLGGGAGATVAQLVLAGSGLPVRAAALVDPVTPPRDVVSLGRQPRPTLILVTGDADGAGGPSVPEELWYALNTRASVPARASLVMLPHVRWARADRPGAEPAARVDDVLTDWFRRNLTT